MVKRIWRWFRGIKSECPCEPHDYHVARGGDGTPTHFYNVHLLELRERIWNLMPGNDPRVQRELMEQAAIVAEFLENKRHPTRCDSRGILHKVPKDNCPGCAECEYCMSCYTRLYCKDV